MYDSFTEAKATVQGEATEVIQLYNDSRAFAPPADAAAYVAAVRFVEWDAMRDGGDDTSVGDAHVADPYRVLQRYEPQTASQTAFYDDAVQRFNDIVTHAGRA